MRSVNVQCDVVVCIESIVNYGNAECLFRSCWLYTIKKKENDISVACVYVCAEIRTEIRMLCQMEANNLIILM